MSQPKLNFTAEEDDKLVEAVAAHPAVYDLHHALYKDQRAKDNIWVVIAGEVGRSVCDCKKRWKNIKDTFDRKNKEIQGTGSKAPPLKKGKKWALQEKLSFLHTVAEERETFSNVVHESEANDEIDTEPENSVSHQETRAAFPTPQPQVISSATSGTHRSKLPEIKKKMNYREQMCLAMEKRAKERDVMMKELLVKEDDESDDISLFYKSIVKTVQKFPPHLQQRAKLETLQLISRIETDMWSSHPSTYVNTQQSMIFSPQSSTYTDNSRPPSSSNETEFCTGVALPLPSPELYTQHSSDIQNILDSAENSSGPVLCSHFTK